MGRSVVQEGDTSCRWIAGNAGALPDCQPSLKRINVITLLIDLADRKVACLRESYTCQFINGDAGSCYAYTINNG